MTDVTYDDRTGTRFERVRLTGATFEDVHLDGARLHDVDLRGASLRMVDLRGLRARDVWLEDVDISGDVENLVINGVDVAPLIEAELDRRDPDRAKMRPTDAAGYREAWDVVERRWAGTVERARSLSPEQLHERVDGEWSFIETLRHLVFATDAWVCRALLGDPEPWDALDLPHDDMPDSPPVPRDREARPTLEQVLALRADRMARVRRVLDGLTDERLTEQTVPVLEPGYPEPESYAVRRTLRTVLHEEWQHRLYAERDLDALGALGAARATGPDPA
ncbi:DinB family protein [Terrabacter carboxydivorans]|uniref:DinB family protein n=1 Tax=Terrabacter carboxydivorans TaxID=619730 RepID=A0ABP5Y1G7_9MICO